MLRKTLLLSALLAIPTLAPATAEAREYCREYTKTVSIGGRTEKAYGTACQQSNGSWEIKDVKGSNYGRDQVRDVIYDDLKTRYGHGRYNDVVITERYHSPKPRYKYNRASYYAPYILNFGFGDRYDRHHKSHYKYHKHKDYKRHKNNHYSHIGKVYKNSRHYNHR